MFARLVAFVCISQFGLCSHLSEPVGPQLHSVVVFLKGGESQNPTAIAAAKQELSKLMRPAGYSIDVRTKLPGPVEGTLVMMEFQGQCTTRPADSVGSVGQDLATTSVAGDHVLPFTQLRCAAIRQTLAPVLSGVLPDLRDNLLGRSLGRIMAHELYHILANDTRHATQGVAKTQFSAGDLLAVHFAFDELALDRMVREIPAALHSGGEE